MTYHVQMEEATTDEQHHNGGTVDLQQDARGSHMDSDDVTVSLPSYREAQQLVFHWGEVDGATFS